MSILHSVHSLVDDIWVYFCHLAISNNSAINIHSQVLVDVFLLCRYLELESLGHMAIIYLAFGGTDRLLEVHHFTFPPAVHEGSEFSTPLPILATVHMFCYNQS